MDLLALRLVRPGTTDGTSDNTSVVVGRKVIKKHRDSDVQCKRCCMSSAAVSPQVLPYLVSQAKPFPRSADRFQYACRY